MIRLLAFFRRKPATITPPQIADCARALSAYRVLKDRERYKARARQMCREMGRPVPEALR